jgi:hypothetical protein
VVLASQASRHGCFGCHPLPNTHTNRDIHPFTRTNSDSNGHFYCDPYGYPYDHLHAHADKDGHANANTDQHTNANTDQHAHPKRDADSHPNAIAHSHAPSHAAPTVADTRGYVSCGLIRPR